jgi:hypothetical protein
MAENKHNQTEADLDVAASFTTTHQGLPSGPMFNTAPPTQQDVASLNDVPMQPPPQRNQSYIGAPGPSLTPQASKYTNREQDIVKDKYWWQGAPVGTIKRQRNNKPPGSPESPDSSNNDNRGPDGHRQPPRQTEGGRQHTIHRFQGITTYRLLEKA